MFKKIKKTPYTVIMFILITALMITLELLSVSFSSIFLIIIGALCGLALYSLPLLKKKEGKE